MRSGLVPISGRLSGAFPPIIGSCTTPPKCRLRLIVTGVDCVPVQVCFPHAAPMDTSEHRRVFGCPLKFEHNRSELVLTHRLLDLPLLKADPVLQNIVEDRS
jgi:hypothetical protein